MTSYWLNPSSDWISAADLAMLDLASEFGKPALPLPIQLS